MPKIEGEKVVKILKKKEHDWNIKSKNIAKRKNIDKNKKN